MVNSIITILTTSYSFPPAALEAATPLRDYVAAAITTATF